MDTVAFVASKLIGALLRRDIWIIAALRLIVRALLKAVLCASGITLTGLLTRAPRT